MIGAHIMLIIYRYKNIVQKGEKRVMDMIKTANFAELTVTEMSEIDGGGIVDSVVNGVSNIWNSWCDMWYDAGRHVYNWTH